MKKLIISFFVFVLLISVFNVGMAQEKDSFEFVFVPKCVHPWYESVKNGAQTAVDEFAKRGIEINVKFNAASTCQVTKFVQTIESTIASNPDGLAIAVLDQAAANNVINEAISRDIMTITFDTDAPESNRLMFVGQYYTEDIKMGRRAAETIAEHIGYEGQVGILIGSPTANGHQNRTKGFKEKIAEYEDIEIVTELADEDNLEKAINLTEQAIKAHPDIKALWAVNATNPYGAAKAIEAMGKEEEIKVVATADMPDTIKYIRQGIILEALCLDPYEMGYWSVYYMWAEEVGHTIPDNHHTTMRIVTPENIKDNPKYDAPEYYPGD